MTRYASISSQLFISHRKKLFDICDTDAIFIFPSAEQVVRNGDQYYNYRQNSDVFYFSGLEQEKTILVFCPRHPSENLRELVFILKPNENTLTWQGHKYTPQEAAAISGIENVLFIDDFSRIFNSLCQFTQKVYMPFACNQRIYTEFTNPCLRFMDNIKVENPKLIFQDISLVVANLRVVKCPNELQLLSEACKITETALKNVLTKLVPDMFEYQVEASITHDFIYHGANGHAYHPIVAAGKNACVLHYNSNSDRCKAGELLLLDFGAEYANYAADCTRTIPINGKFTSRQLQVYNAVLNVFYQVRKRFVPGNTINEINKLSDKLIEEQLVNLGLISLSDIRNQSPEALVCKKYFPHGTSHFLGLDVHDVGSKDQVFEHGMVLTCEPGIYIPEENIGVRIENDIVVAEVPIDLMSNFPIEAEEIEEIMLNKKYK
jgi:Xaa-Pro aminopeptidase